MTVSEIARTDVVTISPDTSVEHMANTLEEEQVGSLVVTDVDGHVLGIVTDRDIGLKTWDLVDPTTVAAGDIMSTDLVSVGKNTGVYEALTVARDANVRRLPVLEDETLYGIVTLDDIIVLLAAELREVSEIIQAESPPY